MIYLSQSEEERNQQQQKQLDKEKMTASEKNIKELRKIVNEKDKYFSNFRDQQFQKQQAVF